jgi:hypothetical protein
MDPAMMQKLSQLAHGGLDGLLQWAVKSLLPVLMRGMSGDMGAMSEAMNAMSQLGASAGGGLSQGAAPGPSQNRSPKNTAFQSGDLTPRLAAAAVASSGTSASAPQQGGRRFYFLNSQTSDSVELRKIAAVAAKLSKDLGIKK